MECPICFDEIDEISWFTCIPCLHKFCSNCLFHDTELKLCRCAMCKQVICEVIPNLYPSDVRMNVGNGYFAGVTLETHPKGAFVKGLKRNHANTGYAALKIGDIIVALNGYPIKTPEAAVILINACTDLGKPIDINKIPKESHDTLMDRIRRIKFLFRCNIREVQHGPIYERGIPHIPLLS